MVVVYSCGSSGGAEVRGIGAVVLTLAAVGAMWFPCLEMIKARMKIVQEVWQRPSKRLVRERTSVLNNWCGAVCHRHGKLLVVL